MSETNPYDFPEEWGDVLIGTFKVPGIITEIDGATSPKEWAVQMGMGMSGASTIYRGEKIAESITVTVNAFDAESFAGMYTLRDLVKAPKGKKPPTYEIKSPIINFAGITRASIKEIPQPKPTKGLSWIFVWTFIQYNPLRIAAVGPADPAKLPGAPKPGDAIDATIAGLVAKMNSL
jgi:hypothetical protein